METKLWLPTTENLKSAGKILRDGGTVAFPTETVYGLGANALMPDAAKKIYLAKGRPSDNPLIVHISDFSELEPLVAEIPPVAYRLAEAYWAGPLTMVFKKSSLIPLETTGGLDTVAVRFPAHPVARELIRLAGVPIAAPSANASGRPSPTATEHVIEDLNGRIDAIIDGGREGVMGLESTIVDVTTPTPTLLRPGFITPEMLLKVTGELETDRVVAAKSVQEAGGEGYVPRAPGMKYRHYAPRSPLTLVSGSGEKVISYINEKTVALQKEGKRVGVIAAAETAPRYLGDEVKAVGLRTREDTIAKGLFDTLRAFDSLKVDAIFSEVFFDNGLGLAIMNRLLKAAGYSLMIL